MRRARPLSLAAPVRPSFVVASRPDAHSLLSRSITNTDLMQLLGDARQVKRFTLWRSSLLSKRGLAHVLKKCPSLVELRIGGSWFGAKEEGACELSLCLSRSRSR